MKKYKYKKSFTFNKKRYYVYADTQAELLIKMGHKMAELESGTFIASSKSTVKDYTLHIFETYRKPKVKEITYNGYIARLDDYVFPVIGHKRLQDIQRSDCQKCLNELEGYATSTIKFIHSTLTYIFRQATLDGLINRNPAEGLIIPKGTRLQRVPLTDDEERSFLKVALATHKYDVFLLSYFCGCRPSEAREVKMDDIIEVDGKKLLHIRGTKTDSSDRHVPVPEILAEHLRDVTGYVGVAPVSGKKLTVDQYQRKWRYLKMDMDIDLGCQVFRRSRLEPSKLQEELAPYCLRHTYCTNLAKKDIPITIAQKLMGHKSIQMTADVYTHVNTDMILGYSEVLNVVPTVVPKG